MYYYEMKTSLIGNLDEVNRPHKYRWIDGA